MILKSVSFYILLLLISGIQAKTYVPNGMVLIPGGESVMGKNLPNADFSPAHTVLIDSFYIDIHEVTNREYKTFCDATGYKLPEFWNMDIFRCGEKYPEHPVVGVSWFDAKKYAAWAGKRLPTEAEWEYAARGGLVEKDYPTGDTLARIEDKKPSESWYNRIVQVGLFNPNNPGVFDMDGNVWEWVEDRYDENYYKSSPVNNPTGSSEGFNRVIRSGSWHSGNMCKKVYYRKGLPANWVDFAVGFRCAKDI